MGWRYRILHWLTRDLHRCFSDAFRDPGRAQAERLAAILGRAAQTAYGVAHGFDHIQNTNDFRKIVPLVSWNALAPWVARIEAGEERVLTAEPVHLFLRTSGTTGPAKLIPCTPGLERETGAARAWWAARLVEEHEAAARGRHLNIYSPEIEGYTAAGIPWGSNTGRIHNRQPWLVRANDPIPEPVFGIKEATTRYDLILRFALATDELATFSTANPSTVLLLMRRLQEGAPALLDELERGLVLARPGLSEETRLQLQARVKPQPTRAVTLRRWLREDGRLLPNRIWPTLASLNCWRCGGAQFYEPQLRDWFGQVPVRDPGFSASEGFVAIPFTHAHPAGVVNVAGHFFEFLPAEAAPAEQQLTAATLLVEELEPGMRVRPVLTTSGGLYRYDLGDVAQVEERFQGTPTLRFLARAGRVLNITGEKVTEAHAETAVAALSNRLHLQLIDFTIGLRFGDPPRYCLAYEGDALPTQAAAALDQALGEANVEYQAKRQSLRLGMPELIRLPPGAYARWRAQATARGAPDGQVKIPHLVQDFSEIEQLLPPEQPT